MFTKFAAMGLILLSTPALAQDLTGSQVLLTNTFEGHTAKGHTVPESDVAKFGMHNNLFATVGEGTEFPEFLTLYDVDISGSEIRFEWLHSDFADKVSGPSPAGNHDRNYFVFDLPEGVKITDITFDEAASNLLDSAALPSAVVIGPNKVMTDFADGVVRGVGFNPVFKITLSGS